MNNILIFLSLAIFSIGAKAEWVVVNSDSLGAQYIDFDKTKRNGSFVKIWTAIDYNEARQMLGKIYRSLVIQEEYDCDQEMRRTLFIVAHSDQMAAGTAVLTDPKVTNWQPTPPGSSGEMFLRLACDK